MSGEGWLAVGEGWVWSIFQMLVTGPDGDVVRAISNMLNE